MYKRISVRLATVAVAALLATPAVTFANSGGVSHSAKACPTHSHTGKDKGSTKGKKKGSTKGKKCGAS
jgi:hypothetical protein